MFQGGGEEIPGFHADRALLLLLLRRGEIRQAERERGKQRPVSQQLGSGERDDFFRVFGLEKNLFELSAQIWSLEFYQFTFHDFHQDFHEHISP